MQKETKSSPVLRSKIVKTGNILRNTALYQIKEYEDKFPKINRVYDELFKDLIIDKYSIDDAVKSVKKLFDKQVLNFVAIDGTEYSRPLFDMIFLSKKISTQ
ncbi:MAG TPA: hypothetical protein VLA74_13595 [Nitrososphaeraceae archaeon]|nr:hypothetical protein [Nitrososphaeraceae archaeon]